jgi:ABC-type antimicrobial peptide transport system permease subunit
MNDESNKLPPATPRWAEKLLEWLVADHLLEEVQGDLNELFEKRLQTSSLRQARFLYVIDLLKLIHPRLWRNKPIPYPRQNPIDMLTHYLLLSFRTFRRFKGTFFINLIGLSTGLACTLLIFLWVNDELSVDKFHENDSRLFQVMTNSVQVDGISTGDYTKGPLAEAFAKEMPEVEYAVATKHPYGKKGILSVADTQLEAIELYAGEDFFKIFSYELIEGNTKEMLTDKKSLVISDELALKLFGTTEDILGKTVEWNRYNLNGLFQISGIYKKVPAHSTAQFDLVLPYELYLEQNPKVREWSHNSNNPDTYVVLKEGADVEQFNAKIAGFLKSKYAESNGTLFIRKYSDRYLYDKFENGVQAGGRITYVRLFSLIAFFILTIACINFMNLSTARASRRFKEVGIKKTIGAGRKSLIFQFLGESLLMTFMAFIVAIMLATLLLPQFNEITGKQLTLQVDTNLIVSILAILLVTGLLSGSYPAIYLSGFKPAMLLKGKFNSSVGELWIRKGLVVFQFTLSIVLIVAVLVVYRQIEYVQTKNLGYTRDNIIYFEKGGKTKVNAESDVETFLYEVKNIPGVVNAANIGYDLSETNGTTSEIFWEGKKNEDQTQFHILQAGYDVLQTLDYEMAAGRKFSKEFGATEKSKIIFNEEAIRVMGLTDPVGKSVKLWGNEYQIIGVTKNFHFESLYEKVKPCFFVINPVFQNVVVKIKAGREKETLASLENFYQKYVGLSINYRFLDEEYQALYAAEQRVAALSKYFASIAIVISGLGLFGLAAFTAERRRKEIGIRKVLGSSEFAIVRLLSGEFMGMVFAAILIALPISYLIARYWLEDFAYAIDLQWWFFAGAGLAALLIAGLTIATQTLRAAKINPIQTLKDE